MPSDVLTQARSLHSLLAAQRTTAVGRVHVEAVVGCAQRLTYAGYAVQALELVDGFMATAESADPELSVRLEIEAVRALYQAASDHECFNRARLAVSKFGGGGAMLGPELAQLKAYEAGALVRLNRVEEAVAALNGLIDSWRGQPDSVALAISCGFLATAFIAVGDWRRAKDHSLEQLVTARRLRMDYLQGVALGNLCIAERGRCRYAAAEDAGQEALEAYRRAGAVPQRAHVARSLAITQLKRGRLERAESLLLESLEEAKEVLSGAQLWYSHLLLSQIRLASGRAELASESISTRFFHRGDIRESRPELLRLEYLGDVELEQGNWQAALDRYDEVLPHALALIPRGDVVAELRRRRAECYLHLGRAQEAHAEAREGLDLCLELGDRYEEAATYRTLALSAAMLGRTDEGKKHFEHGFAMYDDIETPYEWGKLWMSYGDWLCGPHAGAYESLSEAREAYRAACDHFEHMGAQLKLSQARTRLTELERRIASEGHVGAADGSKPRPRRRPSRDRDTQRRIQWAFDTFGVVTQHRPMLDLLEQVATVAVSDIPVLVLGESGTGKELIARGVHALSGRTGSLVEVNCSAVPTTMMESEFFGSVHGSYTGSTRDRAGLFEEAHAGSIFMDEIGEMPVDLQAKLLRFLETGEVRRIGANAGRRVDARLIAATNREADKMRAGDGFRQDLYYRLAHAVFTLPPLRQRGEDAALLVEHFLNAFNEEAKKHVLLSAAARARLLEHSWPGNVRELRALLQRVVVQSPAGHTVTPREIPLSAGPGAAKSFVEEMENQEKSRIVEALEKTHYIKSDAARMLRMSRTTLLGKMKRYQIPG